MKNGLKPLSNKAVPNDEQEEYIQTVLRKTIYVCKYCIGKLSLNSKEISKIICVYI